MADVHFREAVADGGVASVSLSHLSIELGHLYAEQFTGGPSALERHFDTVAPWVKAICAAASRQVDGGRSRIRVSTCFLVDDYFAPFSAPSEVIPMLVKAAANSGLTIDYLARGSGCAQAGDIPLAKLVVARLVSDPPPGTNGSRPPTTESGWLSNGERSPSQPTTAMGRSRPWQPPRENAPNRHSIFVDVQLWSDEDGERTWSCPLLAAVWQLLRLGVLRHQGREVLTPQLRSGDFPPRWDQLPPVVKLNKDADAFAAYRSASVLNATSLPVELAVRTILGQVAVESAVHEQLARRAAAEGVALPDEIVDRIAYAFH